MLYAGYAASGDHSHHLLGVSGFRRQPAVMGSSHARQYFDARVASLLTLASLDTGPLQIVYSSTQWPDTGPLQN